MEAHTPNRDAAIDTHVARRRSRLARCLGDELYPDIPAVAEVAALFAYDAVVDYPADVSEACRTQAAQVVALSRSLDALLDAAQAGQETPTTLVAPASHALTAVLPSASAEQLRRLLEHARAVRGDTYAPDWEAARTRLLDTLATAGTPFPGDLE